MPTLKQDLERVDEARLDVNENTLVELLSPVARSLKIETRAGKEFLRFSLANCLLMERKQLDYGPHNIKKGGVFGCVLRASDKFERIFHLFQAGRRRKTQNESILDSFRDVANYMNIAQIVDLERWPNE